MHEVLSRNFYLVKEHVGMFKASNIFDIYDPETGELILECREDNLGPIAKMLRFTDYKRMTPFDIQIRTPEGEPLVRIHRGVSFFLSRVFVRDEDDQLIGGFQQKFFSSGGAFSGVGPDDKPLCELKGKWTGWDFRFVRDGVEFAHVTKKWAGLGREFFTSADNYILEMSDKIPPTSRMRQLILAAVMCIDMVLKE